jgi:hypothetical protein
VTCTRSGIPGLVPGPGFPKPTGCEDRRRTAGRAVTRDQEPVRRAPHRALPGARLVRPAQLRRSLQGRELAAGRQPVRPSRVPHRPERLNGRAEIMAYRSRPPHGGGRRRAGGQPPGLLPRPGRVRSAARGPRFLPGRVREGTAGQLSAGRGVQPGGPAAEPGRLLRRVGRAVRRVVRGHGARRVRSRCCNGIRRSRRSRGSRPEVTTATCACSRTACGNSAAPWSSPLATR